VEILWLLGTPLAGGLLLALLGGKRYAPELNSLMSFATLAASVVLTLKIISDGPMTAYTNSSSSTPSTCFWWRSRLS